MKELCPHRAVIGLNMAYLREVGRSSATMELNIRCVSCAHELRITRFLGGYGLLGDETGQCEIPSCFKLGWHKSKYCKEHFRYCARRNNGPHQDNAGLRQAFERTQWTYSLAFEKVINGKADIANGKRPGATLICLDIEFSSISRKIFELGVCEYVSGKKLVDARIEHCSDSELHKPPQGKLRRIHPLEKGISTNASAKVYGLDRRKCTNLLNVHGIAAQFQECGITPQSIILTWHLSKMDLVLLREFFEEAGYDDILPPNENCIPMIPHYQKNLPKKFPTKLEVLFPLLFSGHDLVGQNHRALADASQLRLLVMLFEELCKPLNQRDLSMQPKTIQDWVLRANGKKTLLQHS